MVMSAFVIIESQSDITVNRDINLNVQDNKGETVLHKALHIENSETQFRGVGILLHREDLNVNIQEKYWTF